MEWLTCIRSAIDYIERHLTDDIGVQEVADRVYMSPFFLQKGFSVMTGMAWSNTSGAADCILRRASSGIRTTE